jgi:hypothetical protein
MRAKRRSTHVGLRWTIGDVSDAGFQALRLSIWSAWNLFGETAQYAVCVNTIPARQAAARTGKLPCEVNWVNATQLVPHWLHRHVTSAMAEGVAWKLAPIRLFPYLYELSLDNDVILWTLPAAMKEWLNSDQGSQCQCLMAADLQPALGQFSEMCDHRALNSGIRGLPPRFDLGARLQRMLARSGILLQSELDEQGLQAAVLSESGLLVIPTEDVSICSPFLNHQKHLGKCGVHFVGLNPKWMPWTLDDRGAHEVIREHWVRFAEELARLVPMESWESSTPDPNGRRILAQDRRCYSN